MSEQNPGATVHDLIRLREQLTGWIERLDQVGPQASSRAAERVRADYADRLRRVTEDLSSHRGEIEADLERFRGALGQAEEQRLSAADELDELSLRHLIGELDEAAWNEARPDLEARVRDAEDAVTAARAEVERLEQLAADISRAESEAAMSAAAAVAEAPFAAAGPSAEEVPAAPAEAPADEAPAAPASEPELFGGAFDRDATDDFEPQLPDDFPTAEPEPPETMFAAPPAAEPAPPAADLPVADVPAAADAGAADEWDPFGNEFGAEAKPADAEEDLPWLEGIDQAASAGAGWTPPSAAGPADEGLDFLREIEESTRPPATPPASSDLGADDLAFLEELDRAIGSGPAASAGRGARTPPPAEPAAPPAQPAAAGAQRAEPLLCKECGAINEPHSWYCEICGSEL